MTVWTDEKTAQLRKLHRQGLSFSAIGAHLGTTRNAAIGKALRLGLCREPSRSNHQRKSTKRKPAAQVRQLLSPARALKLDGLPIPPPAETDIPRVSFLDLNEDGKRHCKWICLPDAVGVPQDQAMFCGLEPVQGSAYCRGHLMRSVSLVRPPLGRLNGIRSREILDAVKEFQVA